MHKIKLLHVIEPKNEELSVIEVPAFDPHISVNMIYLPSSYNNVSGLRTSVLRWGSKAVQGQNRQSLIFGVDMHPKIQSFPNVDHHREVVRRDWVYESKIHLK